MPIRDYQCKGCGDQQLDILVLQGEPEPKKCERCEGDLERMISAPGGYSIKGSNSASTTPKRFRGGE